MLALHKRLISPKPECIKSACVLLLLYHIPGVGWALTSPDVNWHPVESRPMQAAALPSTVADFEVLVVRTGGVPSCPINIE